MFPDYQAQVVQTYHKKREAGELSLNLLLPTPAKLRDECLVILHDRYQKKDEKTLRAFFEPKESEVDYAQVIRKFDTDKFRPMVNFLKGKTAGPEDKNIELLAWLIDYEPRPYQFRATTEPVTQITPEIQNGKIQETPAETRLATRVPATHELQSISSKLLKNTNNKRYIVLAIILAIAGAGAYILWTGTKPTTAQSFTSQLSGACMYWSEDHYEPVPCDQKPSGRLVLALDTLKLYHFKLIGDNDTISPNSIGKVWYFKTGRGLELYTDSGSHPVHIERRLRPLSRYMWDKYLSQK